VVEDLGRRRPPGPDRVVGQNKEVSQVEVPESQWRPGGIDLDEEWKKGHSS